MHKKSVKFSTQQFNLIWDAQCTLAHKKKPKITLDSGINVAPGITVAPPLKKFHIMILILFYTNLGIAIIFEFFLSSKFFKS